MKFLLISIYLISFIPAIFSDTTASESDFVGINPDAVSLNSDTVLASSPYCSQYKNNVLYFDKKLLKDISDNQYLLKDFNEVIQQEGARLDYYTRFIHIAKGLCYYDDDRSVKSLSDTPFFYNNGTKIDMRYVKTVNCYYMYNKYLAKGIENNFIPKLPCRGNFAEYYNAVFYFVQNSTLCPYPQNNNMISLGDNMAIDNARNQYLLELLDLYKTVEDNEDCYDEYNEEVVNCGYISNLLKTGYCHARPNEPCCNYRSHIQNKIQIKYDFSKGAIIPGIATAAIYLITGMIFSVKSIKDIKAKKQIEEAVANQEKMYRNKNSDRRSSAYSGYSSDHNSYYSQAPNSNYNKNTPIRNPQPLPVSPVDISNYNSNNNSSNYLLGSNNNVASSVVSLNVNQRVSSLYSGSSVDIGSDYSLPIDITSYTPSERPSSIVERPPRTPQLERPMTPNQRYPPSPNLQRPVTPNIYRTGSPNLHPSSPNLQRFNPGTPVLPVSTNLQRPSIPTPSPKSQRPSSYIERPPRTPELEQSVTPRIEIATTVSLDSKIE